MLRAVRQHDGYPADVNGSDMVGIPSEGALDTFKPVPSWAVFLGDVPALGTGAGSVAWVNEYHRNPSETSLVLDKYSQLPERPRVQRPPLVPSNPNPSANPTQVFERDAGLRALGSADDALADNVVRLARHTSLSAPTFLEEPLRGLCALRLKARAHTLVPVTKAVKVSAGVGLTLRIHGDILDTQIYPKPVFRNAGWRLLDLHRGEQVESAVSVEQIGLSTPGAEQRLGSLIAHEWDALSPSYGPYGDFRTFHPPREDAIVEGDGPERLESTPPPLVEPVAIGDLRQKPDDHLGTGRKPFLDLVVAVLMEFVLAKRTALRGYLRNVVGRIIGRTKRRLKSSGLRLLGEQFDHGLQFHHVDISVRRLQEISHAQT
jgi:hypothetical protein